MNSNTFKKVDGEIEIFFLKEPNGNSRIGKYNYWNEKLYRWFNSRLDTTEERIKKTNGKVGH